MKYSYIVWFCEPQNVLLIRCGKVKWMETVKFHKHFININMVQRWNNCLFTDFCNGANQNIWLYFCQIHTESYDFVSNGVIRTWSIMYPRNQEIAAEQQLDITAIGSLQITPFRFFWEGCSYLHCLPFCYMGDFHGKWRVNSVVSW